MNNKQFFGKFGGCYVPEELKEELNKIYKAYCELRKSKQFLNELNYMRKTYQGRPTPLYFCKKLTEEIGGANIYLKREDLNHTGAHKINHCIGEALLAKYLNKTEVIAETGAGQHGVAIATACAIVGLKCKVFMGEIDVKKQYMNVQRMKILGADVITVTSGGRALKDAVDSAFEYYVKNYKNAIYCIGSAVGPFPYPSLVKDFQSVVGREAKSQFKKLKGTLPDAVVACVGGGSNAIGIFSAFLKEKTVKLYGVEAYGKGSDYNSASINFGKEGILHGFNSIVLQDNAGNVKEAYSIASGLDYPSVGPEHAYLNETKRAEYTLIDDKEALNAFYTLSRTEGIIPALESSHAVAYGMKLAKTLGKNKNIIINLSGRGDKDVEYVLEYTKNNNMVF